jgi:hypothetical protein
MIFKLKISVSFHVLLIISIFNQNDCGKTSEYNFKYLFLVTFIFIIQIIHNQKYLKKLKIQRLASFVNFVNNKTFKTIMAITLMHKKINIHKKGSI